MHSIYDNVAVTESIVPQSDTGGGDVNGTIVDTMGFGSAVLSFQAGQVSGTPDSISIAVKLQEGDQADGSDMADARDHAGNVIGGTTADHSVILARIEGLGLNRKRYLRVVETTTFSGGSSPAVAVHASILLGRAFTEPVQS